MRKEEEYVIIVNAVGDKFWKNREGILHRIGGPAIEWSSGRKDWCQMGQLHRIDGPAIDCPDGYKSWYIKGTFFFTKEAFFEALTDEEKKIALFSEAFLNA